MTNLCNAMAGASSFTTELQLGIIQ